MTRSDLDRRGYLRDRIVDVHDTYRARQFTTESNDLMSDPVSPRAIRPHMVRSGLFLLVMAMFVVGYSFGLGISVLTSNVVFSGGIVGLGPRAAGLLSVVSLSGIVIVALAWVVTLMLPVREVVSEYGVVLEGRGDSAARVYAWVRDGLGDRWPRVTIDAEEVLDVPTVRVTNGVEHAAFTVRALGPDLFLGWSLWRKRSTIRLLWHVMRDGLEWSSEDELNAVRASSAIAMRELLRSIARESAQVADTTHGHAAAPPSSTD